MNADIQQDSEFFDINRLKKILYHTRKVFHYFGNERYLVINHGLKIFSAICICTLKKFKHLVLFEFGFCLNLDIWKNLKPQIDKVLFLKPIKFD